MELKLDFPERRLFVRLFGANVYAVGGAVRDLIRGTPAPDVDILVAGHPAADIVRRLRPHGRVGLVGRSFGIINSKESDLNNEYKHDTLKVFEPVLNSLRRLNIAFYDYDGNLYDFQNQEHRLELEFGVWGQMRPGAYSPY